MKKVINEQTYNQKWLNSAFQLGCFDKLGMKVNPVPVNKNNETVLVGVGNKSGKNWLIRFGPVPTIDKTTGLQFMGSMYPEDGSSDALGWTCRALQAEVSKSNVKQTPGEGLKQFAQSELGKQQTTTDAQQTDNQEDTEGDEIEGLSDTQKVKKALELSKKSKQQTLSNKECINTINLFYDYALNYQTKDLGEYHDSLKKAVESCSRQLLQNKKKLKKTTVADLNKNLRFLATINKRQGDSKNPRENQAIYRSNVVLIENKNNLNNLIKEALIEKKLEKENTHIKLNLVESRTKVILENYNKFDSYSRAKKVKTGYQFLREINYLTKMGILNEDLGNIFQSIYGKSLNDMVNSISEPLINALLNGLDLDENFKSNVIKNIQSKGSQIVSNMNDCKDLSKFVSDSISEELVKKFDTENMIKSELINQSLMNAINDDVFRKNLNINLENHVCELFDKFTENAKNLVVRMSSL